MHASMAGTKMLSAGLSRVFAAASKSEEASKLLMAPWGSAGASSSSHRKSSGSRSAACALSDSFSRISRLQAGVECKVPSTDAFVQHKGSKFADTPLQASFYELKQPEAVMREYMVEEAEVGKVECNGRGCRPFLEDEVSTALPVSNWRTQDEAADLLASRTALYHSKSDTRDRARRWSKPHFHLDFAQYLDEVWMETAAAEKHFSAALDADERDSRLLSAYAQFSWRSQSDADKAERLFSQALELAPQDPDILASYAHFLWQADEE